MWLGSKIEKFIRQSFCAVLGSARCQGPQNSKGSPGAFLAIVVLPSPGPSKKIKFRLGERCGLANLDIVKFWAGTRFSKIIHNHTHCPLPSQAYKILSVSVSSRPIPKV